MQTETFTRRPFDVEVKQVTPQNAEEIAQWCGGRVEETDYKLAGHKVKLNIVMVPGNGPNEGKAIAARIGWWVVELNGKFRVYRNREFQQDFVKKEPTVAFKEGELVQELDESEGKVWQGEVQLVDQVLVSYPFRGNVLHDPQELKRINDYSEHMKKKWLLSAEADKGVPYNEALDKINALRAAAEESIRNGVSTDEKPTSQIREDLEVPVTEINGIKTGYKVRIKLEANAYFGQTGTVMGLGKDRVRVLVAMDDDNEIPEPVAFQADELEIVPLDEQIPHLERTPAVDRLMGKLKDLGVIENDPPCRGNGIVLTSSPEALMEKIDAEVANRLASNPTLDQINEYRAQLGYSPIETVDVERYYTFKQDDMVETISEHVIDGLEIPAGTTGRVTVVGIDLTGSDRPGVEVLFSDGTYGHFLPERIKRI